MASHVIDGKTLKQMVLSGARMLDAYKDEVNALNVFPVPDGDTGTNMTMTMTSATREVERASEGTAGEIAAALAQGSLMGARGNSGVILSQLFRGFAKACDGKKTLDTLALSDAFSEGVDTAYKAVMKPVEGTILTVARESAAAAVAVARRQQDLAAVMRVAVEAAEASLLRTPDLLPVLKRAGVVDSGGKGLALILRGYLYALTGEEEDAGVPIASASVPNPAEQPSQRHDISPAAHIQFKVDDEISDIQFPYDCEFFIRRYPGGNPIPMDEIAQAMDPMGDSIYVVGSEELAKVHIHANNPGPVLTLCIEHGDLIDIVIHNMREQHADLLKHAERAAAETAEGAASPAGTGPAQLTQPEQAECNPDEIGVVAVAVGDGIGEIFRSLGASGIIQGGQTMNPSTQDLLEAVQSCPSSKVILLPNNKNIILAAQQAAALTEKQVLVIPSCSIPQGIAAMVSFLPDAEMEKLERTMNRAISEVQTGEITFSVRDTLFGDLTIHEGDILGLWNGQIKLTGSLPEVVLGELLEQMVAEHGGEVISVYWGEAVDEERASRLGEELRGRFPDHDVEVQFGGQPLYYYLFSLE